MHHRLIVGVVLALGLGTGASTLADLPSSFDLRSVGGENFVTSVKNQLGGTCWTHGTMAAIESNLLMTGTWAANQELASPDLAEYHLDWWNGFNDWNNDDIDPPTGAGLEVHYGGDYMVATAYLSRGEGAVRDVDGQSYSNPPPRSLAHWHYYYPRHVEWFVAKSDLSDIDRIKQAVMDYGAVATCMASSGSYIQGTVHYQPAWSDVPPNHSVAIVGWDDAKPTHGPAPGAWLCKNSWGDAWGEAGFFWISYYDKWCGQEPQMGAVTFRAVERMRYDKVFYHDYHGWRDTLAGATEAFNAFVPDQDCMLQAVSFFSAADGAQYTIRIYDRFEGGQLHDELTAVSGAFPVRGFHTVDLPRPLGCAAGDDFFIYLELSAGGQPYDCSSEIPVLLGARTRTWVDSSAQPGQSFYRSGGNWVDLTTHDASANFCIKGLGGPYRALEINLVESPPPHMGTGIPLTVTAEITEMVEDYVPGSATLHYRYQDGAFTPLPMTALGNLQFEATLPPAGCGDHIEFYVEAVGDLGGLSRYPVDAPATLHLVRIGRLATILSDDFESDLGWSVVTAPQSGGDWERGVPAGSGDRGDPTVDFDGSGACFLTENGLGDADVDNGPTELRSPVFNLDPEGYYTVAYARWMFTTELYGDYLVVDVSNTGGSFWTRATQVSDEGGWVEESFVLNDYITPSAQTRIRFCASDIPNNSVVEAAIDAFMLKGIECQQATGDLNCDGVVDFGDINPFVLVLTNPSAYDAEYGSYCDSSLADLNGDDVVDYDDINPFVVLLTQ